MKLSIVIPCYGSENTIEGVVDEIENTIQKRDVEHEIILVNDCSPDHVWDKIVSLSQKYEYVHGVSFAKNFGQHSALMAGYRETTGDIVISMDDDGQTPADELFKLVDQIEAGYDVVYATYDNKQHNVFRNLGSRVNDKMCNILLGKPKGLMVTSYFAAKRFIVDEICRYNNSYTYVIGLVLRSTKNIGTVPVTHRKREEGSSGYTFGKLINLWLNGFTAFSVKPLRFATMAGIIIASLGFLGVIYIVINKLINPLVPVGWSSTMVALCIIGGLILFTLGMIGEYLGRVYISINDAPQYVIRDKTKDSKIDK
ncbi:MAG: glycosyltransferase family 2 protein [Lachnospiraceae bacterium]|nr:glycosyltransferase family 2 protein [Lachnospiraceae bacterium]